MKIKLNSNEVVNGLYEIMLSSREDVDGDLSLENNLQDDTSNKNDENIDKNIEVKEDNEAEIESEQTASDERSTNILYLDSIKKKENEDTIKNYIHELEKNEKEPVTPFPKSVVKTTRGAVIGEYYYDPEVSKSRRHYIYNSNFFATYFINTVNLLNEKFDQTVYSEAIQLIEDVYKRMKEQSMLHFEISTNEILNRKALKELWNNMKQRLYNEVLVVCNRLKAKISALGSNYTIMLKEQMARYREM